MSRCAGIMVAAAVLLALAPLAEAQNFAPLNRVHGRHGLGISVGAPDGFTFEEILGDKWALDLAAGSNAFADSRWMAHLNLIYIVKELRHVALAMPVYVGLGGAVTSPEIDASRELHSGVRIPFGVQVGSPVLSFQLYLEVATRIELDPEVDLGFEGALGFRFFR